MKKIAACAIAIIVSTILTSRAQEVTSTAGNYEQFSGGSISWSLGEFMIETVTNGTNGLTQGFHQTDLFSKQVITIPQGWSYISSFLDPADADVTNMWADVVGANNLLILTGVSGIYAPAPFYINTLGNWNVYKGYKVKMNNEDNLNVRGDLAKNTVLFAAGLHLIPVLHNEITQLDEVFDNPATDILYMLDLYSNQVYWPLGGIYTLSELVPGKGYLANFKNPVTLSYPPMTNFTTDAGQNLPPAPGPWSIVRTTSVHLISVSTEAISQLPDADFIGAFDASGKCAGYAEIEKTGQNLLLTIYGDEPITSENDGMLEGEMIYFRAYNSFENTRKELTATFNTAFPNTDGLFAANGLSGISGFKESATGVGENDLAASVQVYPNPAKDVVNIIVPRPLTVHETSGLSGFDHETSENLTGLQDLLGLKGTLITAEGKLIKTFTITSPETQLDVSGLQPGIYLLKIASSQNIVIKRVIIQ